MGKYVWGFPFFAGTRKEFVASIKQHLEQSFTGLPMIVFTPNPEQVMLARRNAHFDDLLRQATYLLPDGQGIVWASRLLHDKGQSDSDVKLQRISGVDVVSDLLTEADCSAAVIGGRGYPAEISLGHARIHTCPGYADVTHPSKQEERTIEEFLKKNKPELLFVALGAPYQEEFVVSHLSLLVTAETKVVMVVGGAFDLLLGKIPRAPKWLQRLGLEWAFRLVQEPWRWKRQLSVIQFGFQTILKLFA